jgi:hypothetical protein
MRQRTILLLAAVLTVAGITASCLPPPPPPPPTVLSITTTPSLFPGFSLSVVDYVSRCASTPVSVSVEAPVGTSVSVDGGAWATGRFTASVTRAEGQTFTIIVKSGSTPATTHFVRCLPDDFPNWDSSTSGATAAQWYITNPITGLGPTRSVIFDTHGVPVWWSPLQQTHFTTLLPDDNLATTVANGIEERRFDGSLVRTVDTVNGPNDGHDVLLLPNGNFVMVANITRSGVDLTSIGGPASTSIIDQVIEEIDPSDGHLVWSWDTADHIPVTSMDPQWRTQYVTNATAPYDVFHWNSIEPTADGFIASYRHLDAVYEIDTTSSDIVWKLGGSAQAESLTVVADPVFTGGSHFGGQHDARLLDDGTVTLFDDGSNLGRAPRAVRYDIDVDAGTATLVESIVADPDIGTSFCCGSARRMGTHDWVIGWGGTATGTENVSGSRRFSISFPGAFLYRLVPVPFGVLDRDALRAGMDAQYGTGTFSSLSESPSPAVPSLP